MIWWALRRVRRVPPWREPLRRAAKHHAPRRKVRATVEGLTFDLVPRDNKVDFDIWWKRRLPEPVERSFLARHLPRGGLFVDIGANIGVYTVALARAVPELQAVTFEPLDKLRLRQCANLALNGVTADRISVRAEAIGPGGPMMLHENRNAGAASLLPTGAAHSRTVETVPLVEALGTARPHALKIDVEGFEDAALMPFFDIAPPARWPNAVVLETLHRAVWRRDCLSELCARGYILDVETFENACLVRPEGDADTSDIGT